MDDAAFGHVPAGISGLRRPQAEIEFLVIKEIGFVEQADFLDHGALDHQAGAGNPVDFRGVVRHARSDAPPFEQPRDEADADRRFEFAGSARKSKRAGLRRAVRVFQTRSRDAGFGMGIEEGRELCHGSGPDPGVRVQEQIEPRGTELRVGCRDRPVVAERKPAVAGMRDQRHPLAPSAFGDRLAQACRIACG